MSAALSRSIMGARPPRDGGFVGFTLGEGGEDGAQPPHGFILDHVLGHPHAAGDLALRQAFDLAHLEDARQRSGKAAISRCTRASSRRPPAMRSGEGSSSSTFSASISVTVSMRTTRARRSCSRATLRAAWKK
jgi:hypothetical protein